MLWNERLQDCILNKTGIAAIQTALNTKVLREGESNGASKRQTGQY